MGTPTLGAAAAQVTGQLNGRIALAQQQLSSLTQETKRYDGTLWLDNRPSEHKELARIANNGAVVDGSESLSIGPHDHIGVSGPNGSGKTTLIRRFITALHALGDAAVPFLYIPQNISAQQAVAAMKQLDGLSAEGRATVLSAYAQLNALPAKLLAGRNPSPGELRKLMLCLGVLHNPQLIIMDEPTNHLDFHSKQALANTLAAYSGALVVVSHDEWMLEAVSTTRWRCPKTS